jgi:hypothetical protein
MNAQVPKAPPVWRQADGKPVSCLEKIKVLNQNIQEIEGLCADALEDGVLMGCDAQQIKAALHELLLSWLPRLTPTGKAQLVVGKNLGADSLQRWLGEQGYPTKRLASAKGFRVLAVHDR